MRGEWQWGSYESIPPSGGQSSPSPTNCRGGAKRPKSTNPNFEGGAQKNFVARDQKEVRRGILAEVLPLPKSQGGDQIPEVGSRYLAGPQDGGIQEPRNEDVRTI